ncbi:hypothetical protein C0J52_02295 [Blattella germanica]|nr:hypothetical protein C0J52_02295 [Blattella germanica]
MVEFMFSFSVSGGLSATSSYDGKCIHILKQETQNLQGFSKSAWAIFHTYSLFIGGRFEFFVSLCFCPLLVISKKKGHGGRSSWGVQQQELLFLAGELSSVEPRESILGRRSRHKLGQHRVVILVPALECPCTAEEIWVRGVVVVLRRELEEGPHGREQSGASHHPEDEQVRHDVGSFLPSVGPLHHRTHSLHMRYTRELTNN